MDTNKPNNNHYYRIKQVDFDGRASYSRVISLSKYANALIFRNLQQSRQEISFETNFNKHMQVILYDLQGRLVETHSSKHTLHQENETDWITWRLQLSHLATGLYIIRLQDNYNQQFIKFIKQ